jgi:hypothetical protein
MEKLAGQGIEGDGKGRGYTVVTSSNVRKTETIRLKIFPVSQ